ncbi:hypothetical protein DSO57_1039103 [Entomophthora muscae]|nr:hypothetical protein DSO57_1039103 [Entomophthora muscae]
MSASGTAFRITHDLVAQFLASNGYKETLEKFYEEGGDFATITRDLAHIQNGADKPLVEIVTEYYLHEKKGPVADNRKEELTFSDHAKFSIEKVESLKVHDTLHTGNIICVKSFDIPVVSDEGRVMVTSSTDKSIKISSLQSGMFLMAPVYPHDGGAILSFDVHPLHPHLLLTSSMDFSVALTNLETNTRISVWNHHKKFVVHAKFAPDGSSFISACYDHSLVVYTATSEPHDFSPARTFEFDGNVEAACFSPDSKWVIVGVRDDNYLHYIDLKTFEVIKFNMNANGDNIVSFTVMDLAVSPSGTHVLATTDHRSGRVILFKMSSNVICRDYYGVPQDEFSTPKLCWHPSGRVFFVTGDDFKIHVFDTATCAKLGELSGHTGVIRTLWYDVPSASLLSGSFDRTIRHWGSKDKETAA